MQGLIQGARAGLAQEDWAAKDAAPDVPKDYGAVVCRDGASSGCCGSCRCAQQQVFVCQGSCWSLHHSAFKAGQWDGGVGAQHSPAHWGFKQAVERKEKHLDVSQLDF